jgi:hypothetical protein
MQRRRTLSIHFKIKDDGLRDSRESGSKLHTSKSSLILMMSQTSELHAEVKGRGFPSYRPEDQAADCASTVGERSTRHQSRKKGPDDPRELGSGHVKACEKNRKTKYLVTRKRRPDRKSLVQKSTLSGCPNTTPSENDIGRNVIPVTGKGTTRPKALWSSVRAATTRTTSHVSAHAAVEIIS